MKTVLKTVAVILVLAGVFFFALRMWESRRQPSGPGAVPSPEAQAPVTIKNLSVQSTQDGVTVMISEVPGPGYTIMPMDDQRGFVVDVPGAQLGLLQNSLPKPHALISMIDSSQIPVQGVTHARFRILVDRELNYRDRLQGTTLLIDLTPREEPTVVPTEMERPRPTPKPVLTKKPVASRTPKVTKPKPVATKKPKVSSPKPRPKPVARRTPEPEPFFQDEPVIPPMEQPTPEPTVEPPVARVVESESVPSARVPQATPPPEGAPLDLSDLFGEVAPKDGSSPPPVEAIPTEEPPQVAVLEPPSSGKFESTQLLGNLPSINSLSVGKEGAATAITIERESKVAYKIFRLVNPSRLVVDFRDAANKLQPTYGAVRGTKVKKITTGQFKSADGALVRVTIEIEGAPKYEKEVRGNSLVLKIK